MLYFGDLKMNNKGDINWQMVMLILAILFLVVLSFIFRDQIGNVVNNIVGLTPKNDTIMNLSKCINNPGLPECMV